MMSASKAHEQPGRGSRQRGQGCKVLEGETKHVRCSKEVGMAGGSVTKGAVRGREVCEAGVSPHKACVVKI